MLAAQCSKLRNKSPPPLAEATVGKGFFSLEETVHQNGLLGMYTYQ